MATTPSNEPTRRGPSRRVVGLAIAVLLVVAVALALLGGYLFFFGSEAPAAPTLDDALKVLLPSPSA